MNAEPVIKPLRLIFQGSVTVENAEDADIIYDELKTFVKSHGPDSTLNGQVMKMLEPCCNKPPVIVSAARQSQTKGQKHDYTVKMD
jgi:hypothetical protein